MASKLKPFLAELRRRKVYQVGAAYLAVGLAVLGAAEVILGLLAEQPVIVLIAVLGFPVALILAWTYELRAEDAASPVDIVPSSDREGIVVLPLDNMSPDPGDAYFSDGLTEEIITRLAHLHSLRVISRSSAMAFKNTEKDVRTIGRELDVQYVLEGSVRKAGDSLRITAQLIDAETDEHLWAHTYDRELEDVFTTQSEIALSVAGALKASLEADSVERIKSEPTENLDAHDAYLLGAHHWWRLTEEGASKAIAFYQRAIELDPSYADAHAGLALAYVVAGGSSFHLIPTGEAMARARSAAERAIALDPVFGEAHATLGLVLCWYYWDWKKAEEAVRHGVALDANSSLAWGAYAHVMDVLGKHEDAMEASDRFVELDPLQALTLNNASNHYCHAGRLERAMELAERCVELDPSWWGGAASIAYVHLFRGEYDEALSHVDPVREELRSTFFAPVVAYLFGRTGRHADFSAAVADLEAGAADGIRTWTEVAYAYMGIDDHERALRYLEKAPDQRPPGSNWTAWIRTVPQFEPIRDHPRFQNVLKRLNLA